MKDLDFPIFKTKQEPYKKFDLNDVADRQKYFEYKAGDEIKKLQTYLAEGNTFIAYLLGKKSSGKGTYSKMFAEVVDKERVAHFSIGDMIRSYDSVVNDETQRKELVEFLQKEYRGFMSAEDMVKAMQSRSTKTLLPTELILALAKREIAKLGKKAIFIDGFPRDLDQVSYALFFRDLIGYRADPDVFVLIDVPSSVIDERVKNRLICPLCQTSRNLKLLPTKNVEYDANENKFYLHCDNPVCSGPRMVTKEGDELGVAPIKDRLDKDEMLIREAFKLQGIPKVLLRNSFPVSVAEEYYDDYEITPEYEYHADKATNVVTVDTKPWQVPDDEGVASNSLTPPPVVVALIKQLVGALGL
jgi:adenylate kinase family enzyme